jgi:hypothetical protein
MRSEWTGVEVRDEALEVTLSRMAFSRKVKA